MLSGRKKWLAATVFWMGLIFFSSTSLAARMSEDLYDYLSLELFPSLMDMATGDHALHFLAEKSVHVTLFLLFGFLVAHLVNGSPARRVGKIALAGLIVGSCSEYLQSFFPGRDPAIRDVILNTTCATLGGLATVLWSRRKKT